MQKSEFEGYCKVVERKGIRTMVNVRIKCLVASALLLTVTLCACQQLEQSSCDIVDLKVDYRTNPFGIGERPVFSWRMETEVQGQEQTAYQIVVSGTQQELEKKEYIWDSGKVFSDISVAIPYEGAALDSEEDYYWKVFVWDQNGQMAVSNENAVFETGIWSDNWADAQWIGMPQEGVECVSGEKCGVPHIIEYDVRLDESYSGLIWGMETNQYGEYCRWDLDTLGEGVELIQSEMDYDTVLREMRLSLTEDFQEFFGDKELFCGTPHHIQIVLDDSGTKTYVDGTMVSKTDIGVGRDIGRIGLWTTRGAQYAYYDNIRVSDAEDHVLYDERFEEECNIFTPYYCKVTDGWCEASSGWLLMPGGEEPAPMLRKEFEVYAGKEIASAKVYASALGIYDIYINGVDVCDEYMAPGQSVYAKEVYYQTYDITEQIQNQNAIGIILGHGRYNRGNMDWGDYLAFCAMIVIRYTDGSMQTVVTDDTWSAYNNGPIRNDDMFSGEYYDANFVVDGWSVPGFTSEGWQQAQLFEQYSTLERIAAVSAPVRCVEMLTPVAVTEPEPGVYVYDFGQNFNGNCHITFKNTNGKAGQVVTMRYAEALNEEMMSCRDDAVGTIWTQNLYTADNTDYYVMNGNGTECFTPTFVYRGFRYVQVSGISEGIAAEDIQGLVITSDNDRTGQFVCSDEQMNKLYDSIYWTQLSNYVDIPMDCPQRDERLGWTGDAQVFAHTADYNADVYGFFSKYIRMLRVGQCDSGLFPQIAPSINMNSGANGWSDAGVILVWELYQQYGNQELIRENLESMCRYVDYLVETSDDFIRRMDGYGDHHNVSDLDIDIVNTAQCAYTASLLADMCSVVGENGLAEKYDSVYSQYKSAWQGYINDDGSIADWQQSAYTLGLAFDLYPDALKEKGAACLNVSVNASDYHISTGYVATPFLLPVLCEYGYTETAYRIAMQDTYPSWNYMLSRNGTTISEAWFTYYETENEMYAINGSLNHPALGSVGEWFYEGILGIKRDKEAPAYKHFYLQPQVNESLQFAYGSYESMYGMIESGWKIEGNSIIFAFTIPPNTTATVTLPDSAYREMELGSGKYEFSISTADLP